MSDSSLPTLSEIFKVCYKIGILSFGGPAAQIALMHRVIVEEKQWLNEQQYLSGLSFCMLLPGPEAMQLATYVGWRLQGTLGGLIAGLLFVLPGALVIFLLALVYAYFGHTSLMAAAFLGVKSVILVVVVEALVRVAKKALITKLHWLVAALSFIGLFLFDLPYPLVILTAAVLGFSTATNTNNTVTNQPLSISISALQQTVTTVFVWLGIWLLPLFIVGLFTDWGFLFELGLFFSKLATVTFGGAYAVLAYMSQAVVFDLQWLSTAHMIDGLGLAETTPGPLILVAEFVGFMAGFKAGGLTLAVAAALLVLWVTFTPCFLWIFVGAPYIEWLTQQPRLQNALATIVAAVVGVILSLSIWFGIHVFFNKITSIEGTYINTLLPDISTINGLVMGLALMSYYLLHVRKVNIFYVLGVCALVSMSLTLF